MIFNVAATILSVVALISSTFIALQHRALQKRANFLPAYMKVLDQFRSMEFHDNYLYVSSTPLTRRRFVQIQHGLGSGDQPARP